MEATTSAATQAADQQARLAAETLSGDLRDVLLTHIRSMETPWSKLSEREQQNRIHAIEKAAETMVRGAVRVVANHGFPHMIVQTGKWNVGDGVELKVSGQSTVENITKLAEHGMGAAVLVLCEVGEFFGQRSAAEADPDQPAMDLGADEDGDSEEQGEGGEAAPAAAEAKPAGRGRNRRTIRETEAA